ncbi:hypothetical protein AB685_14840 [Bacillus sp. LL01]|uniref:hypothetical protein n=1 Tax=Bacillus sp. LL01 TaxID=1665556 RepID=UPI00064D03EE|nr:hypothetical protein [Bacillus sp. LL01]KMJ58081.1 hypothetical protein AB685_14840 [Bacillus sp. LL01]
MGLSIFEADQYIATNVIDIEDWEDADDDKKQRLLNVAQVTLTRKFSKYVVPASAVYDFSNVLAIANNDTNRLNNHGIAGFSITGVGSFNFKDTMKRDLEALIPQSTIDLIGEENGVNLSQRRVGRSVR